MTSTQKRVFVSLLLISLVYFVIFIFPNDTHSPRQQKDWQNRITR